MAKKLANLQFRRKGYSTLRPRYFRDYGYAGTTMRRNRQTKLI